MNVEIRIATARDAACACKVVRRSISECCGEDHGNDAAILEAWLGNKTAENVEAWILSPANFSVVAIAGDAVAGIAMLTRGGKIVLCYVCPDRRFSGIGKALLLALEAQAKQWNLRTLTLVSTATAKTFYAHCGYGERGTTQSSIGLDLVSFSKRLGSGSYPRKIFCNCGD